MLFLVRLAGEILYCTGRIGMSLCAPRADQLPFRDRGRERLDFFSARSRVHPMYMYSVITLDKRGSGEDLSHSEYMLSWGSAMSDAQQ